MASQKRALLDAKDQLARARKDAYDIAAVKGAKATQKLMKKAAAELAERLVQVEASAGVDSFSAAQIRATLLQVDLVLTDIKAGLKKTLLSLGQESATAAVEDVSGYLVTIDKAFKGVGSAPLGLREAAMLDRAIKGSQSSLLNRIVNGPDAYIGDPTRAANARKGILERYGEQTVLAFEEKLQLAMLTKQPWAETRNALISESPFLQGKPLYWAERIVRTESMCSYNMGAMESLNQAQEDLGDMVKILSATFDNRTASDSYALHGQIRRPHEPFDGWTGSYMHPPNRPNDREVVVPHRIAWPIPDYLAPKSDAAVMQRWMQEGRTGSPPPRPLLSTVPRSSFGK